MAQENKNRRKFSLKCGKQIIAFRNKYVLEANRFCKMILPISFVSVFKKTFLNGSTENIIFSKEMVDAEDDFSQQKDLKVTFSPPNYRFDPSNLRSTFPPMALQNVTARVEDQAGNSASCIFQVFFKRK